MSVQTEVDVPVLSDPDENAERTEEAENADDVSEVAGNHELRGHHKCSERNQFSNCH